VKTCAREKNTQLQKIHKVILEAVSWLPKAADDPLNAYYRSRETNYDIGHHGGGKMSRNSVTISLRALHELLAGRRSIEEFNALHSWRTLEEPGITQVNPFDRTLAEGRMVKDVRVERDENADDDWITLEFGQPDAAISPFVVRRKP
jgi:hypothetical protein